MKKCSVAIWPTSFLAASLFIGCSHSGGGARTTPATESIKGQYIGPTLLVDAGNTTPEAALESVFWASANGNYDTVINSYVPQKREEIKNNYGSKDKAVAGMRKKFASFKGLQILARKTVADDNVELRYYCEFQSQRPNRTMMTRPDQVLLMVKIGGAWKCGDKTPYTTNWDEGSQPEPQS
jgi:hypothetical protein